MLVKLNQNGHTSIHLERHIRLALGFTLAQQSNLARDLREGMVYLTTAQFTALQLTMQGSQDNDMYLDIMVETEHPDWRFAVAKDEMTKEQRRRDFDAIYPAVTKPKIETGTDKQLEPATNIMLEMQAKLDAQRAAERHKRDLIDANSPIAARKHDIERDRVERRKQRDAEREARRQAEEVIMAGAKKDANEPHGHADFNDRPTGGV